MKIVCFGEALIDFLAQPGATPDAPRAFLQFAGGAPANVAVAAARLGAQAQFVGMLDGDLPKSVSTLERVLSATLAPQRCGRPSPRSIKYRAGRLQ